VKERDHEAAELRWETVQQHQNNTKSSSGSIRQTTQNGPDATSAPTMGSMLLLQGPRRGQTGACLRGGAEDGPLVLGTWPLGAFSGAIPGLAWAPGRPGGASGAVGEWRYPGRLPAHLSRRVSSSWHVPGTCTYLPCCLQDRRLNAQGLFLRQGAITHQLSASRCRRRHQNRVTRPLSSGGGRRL
jgi:hypothetical protein